MNLDSNGKSINYVIRGNGQSILLVHGWGGSSKSLKLLAELLAKKYRVFTLDLPGFGLSDDPDKDWGVEEYAQLLMNIIDKLKIKPVIYFGHSFGGALGILIAAKYPAYIKKLVISGASFKRTKSSTTALSQLFKGLPTPLKKIIYQLLYPQSDLYKVPKLEANFRKIMTQDLTPYLDKIKIPTLIVWGENDLQTPVKLAEEAQPKIKNSSLKIFPEIGHNLPLKYPDLVYQEIEKFL